MPAQLVALDSGPSILLDKPILLLGRHPECDIQIDSRKISRRHCCIAQVSDYLVIRDLGSTNGIRINGVRLIEGRLSAGDELTIGNNRYKVAWDARTAAVAPSRPSHKPEAREPAPAPHAVEDDLLESSDEPIPLEEPRPAGQAQGLPIAPVAPSLDPPSPAPKPPSEDLPLLLPDVLELMPNSDHFPKSAHPSESGVHPPA